MSKATSFFALLAGLLLVGVPRPAAAADELAPDVATAFDLSTFATGLVLPTAIEFLPDGRLVITEKLGQVLVRLPNGTMVEAGKFDVDSHTEKGLLNVIRHPDFVHNHQLIFFYSSAKAPDTDKQKISIVRLGDDNHLDFSTERVLLKDLRGPDDHEMGGGLAIDREGDLLIGVGDTGCRAHKHPEPPYAPTNYFASCLTNGNGKILRVGLDGSIPADNPLVNVPLATTCGEKCGDDPFSIAPSTPRKDIWVWGVRNPWRIWVDPKTGYVWTADVGDITNEEIDVIPPEGGRDYGWPWREGGAGHALTECKRTLPDRGNCAEPAYFCRHDDAPGDADAGCKSINGGLIVDDCRWPDAYRGRYFFADNANGRIWSLAPTPDRKSIVKGSRKDVGHADGFVVDMDTGPDGALYLAVMRIPPDASKVLRIAPRVPRTCSEDAAQHAETADVSGARAPAVVVTPPASHARHSRRRLVFGAIAALALLAAAGIALSSRSS